MALNKIAAELQEIYLKDGNSLIYNPKINLTFLTEYIIEISKQTGQDFHESITYFLKIFLTKISDSKFKFVTFQKTYLLFISLTKEIICSKYMIKTYLEESVILSVLSLSENTKNHDYPIEIEEIFNNVEKYSSINGKFSHEVKEALSEIIEKCE